MQLAACQRYHKTGALLSYIDGPEAGAVAGGHIGVERLYGCSS